jgi:hypothetical protein
MDTENSESIKAAKDLQVPEALLEQLHAADAQLHEARESLEQTMDASDYSHQKAVTAATGELSTAEHTVEEISVEIHKSLTAGEAGSGSK